MIILAAVDGSDHAKQVVNDTEELAGAFDTEMHVVHVMSRAQFVELQDENVGKSGRPIEMERIKQSAAEVATEAVDDPNVAYETVGLVGDVAPSIIEYAEDHEARYLVVGGRKRSPTGKALFGSVTQSVLLNADRPVVTVLRRD